MKNITKRMILTVLFSIILIFLWIKNIEFVDLIPTTSNKIEFLLSALWRIILSYFLAVVSTSKIDFSLSIEDEDTEEENKEIPINKFKTTLPTDRNTEVNREELDSGYPKDYNGNEIIHEPNKPL